MLSGVYSDESCPKALREDIPLSRCNLSSAQQTLHCSAVPACRELFNSNSAEVGVDSLSTESLNELFIALTVAQASRTGVSIIKFVYIRIDVCFVE